MRRNTAILLLTLLMITGFLILALKRSGIDNNKIVKQQNQTPQKPRSKHRNIPDLNYAEQNRHKESYLASSTSGTERVEQNRLQASTLTPSSSSTSPHASELDVKIQRQVERLKNTSTPIEKRRRELAALAEKDDPDSAAVLMALARSHTYLNAEAVEALGTVDAPGVKPYLHKMLTHKDPKVICAALKSIATQEADNAVDIIIETLKTNRERPDGFQDMVCAVCVQTLGRIGSPKAIPALDEELRETVGPILQHDYGSKVVSALSAIGDPAARQALESYADRLEAIIANAPDNQMGRKYLLEKIKEARTAAANLADSSR